MSERDEFEAWHKRDVTPVECLLERRADGRYDFVCTQNRWEGWQAARTTIQQASVPAMSDEPPQFWWIRHGSHGQITMRADEARQAAKTGAKVYRYARATPPQAVPALISLCQWLLHRFGPDSPEGREAYSRLHVIQPSKETEKGPEMPPIAKAFEGAVYEAGGFPPGVA